MDSIGTTAKERPKRAQHKELAVTWGGGQLRPLVSKPGVSSDTFDISGVSSNTSALPCSDLNVRLRYICPHSGDRACYRILAGLKNTTKSAIRLFSLFITIERQSVASSQHLVRSVVGPLETLSVELEVSSETVVLMKRHGVNYWAEYEKQGSTGMSMLKHSTAKEVRRMVLRPWEALGIPLASEDEPECSFSKALVFEGKVVELKMLGQMLADRMDLSLSTRKLDRVTEQVLTRKALVNDGTGIPFEAVLSGGVLGNESDSQHGSRMVLVTSASALGLRCVCSELAKMLPEGIQVSVSISDQVERVHSLLKAIRKEMDYLEEEQQPAEDSPACELYQWYCGFLRTIAETDNKLLRLS